MKRFQYYKVASLSPEVQIGNPMANANEILSLLQELPKDTQLAVFPELAITGYTCQDLFYEDSLLESALQALEHVVTNMPKTIIAIIGLPLVVDHKLYNTAAVCIKNKVLGFHAKTFIPNYNEFYETRWFSSSRQLKDHSSISLLNENVPVSDHLLFMDTTTKACIGVEICEDLWVPIPTSSKSALAGANIIANCSASNELIAKQAYRRNLVMNQSARTYTGYIYSSASFSESTSDLVFSHHDIICESGTILAECTLENPKKYIVSEIDIQHLNSERLKNKTSFEEIIDGYTIISYASHAFKDIELTQTINPYPFVIQDVQKRKQRSQEILHIQAQGLATRLKKIHSENVVIGISGGLDSTLALLVCHEAFQMNHLDPKGIHAITMPGFGTTKRTKSNAQKLMDLLNVSSEEISIVNSVNQHFKDIHHNPDIKNITYENSQARERTQILMDLANTYNGFVIGTGDLSELALGWCTYNGDHMSMYAVNASIPKTLVRYICETKALSYKEENQLELYKVLMDICDTPVSPELLPPDENGQIQQKTEDVLGSYDLHDFFLYHMLRFHESPTKIYELAKVAFETIEPSKIYESLKTFYSRFFMQQFKRNCMPDGVKVGSICLSPRGDWRMPSDANKELWLNELNNLIA